MRVCDSSIMARMQMPPGLSFGNFKCEEKGGWALRAAFDGWTIEVYATGWGPTLHTATMEWKADCIAPGADEQAAAFTRHLEVQRRRFAASRKLGFGDCRPRDADLLGHMVADRLTKAMRPRLPDLVRREVERLETLDIDGLKTSHSRDGLVLAEGTSDDPRPRASLKVMTPWGSYDGARLIINKAVPETVVAAIAGRKVGEIIEQGDRLDAAMLPILDRTIVAAYANGATLALETEPDWVQLAV